MKIFAIIKNNTFAKIIFVLVSLMIIFNQVIYHIIKEKLFKQDNSTNKDNSGNKDISESFTNLKNKDNNMFMDKEFINNLKIRHDKIHKNAEINVYPNLDSKRCNLFLTENKFLPECCILNYEFSSGNGCPCMTPQQKYYLQYRGNNRNKKKIFNNK